MDVYQISPTIRRFVEAPRKEWKTEMWPYHSKGHVKMETWLLKREYSKVPPCLHYCSVSHTTNQHAQWTRS
jgi:hypothetical protein